MGVWLQPLQGQGVPDSPEASVVPPHQAFASLAADPFAADPLVVDPLAVDALAADPVAVDPVALCDAAAAAVAAGVQAVVAAAVAAAAAAVAAAAAAAAVAAAAVAAAVEVEQVAVEQVEVEQTQQLQLALALTASLARLASLACPLFQSDLAFQAYPEAFQSFAAALRRPHADGFAALPVAWAPCLPTSFCGISAAGLCQLIQSLLRQQ